MDIWEAFERSAIEALRRNMAERPVNRESLTRALHLLAIAKGKDPHAPMPPVDILTDSELIELTKALLEGNRIGN